MNEQTAIAAILRDRFRPHLCIPRYTPRGWWECDVFEVTAAGMFREYEVKLTVADFRADARKREVRSSYHEYEWGCSLSCPILPTKHQRLAAAEPAGPTRFWYVTPEGLLTPQVLPPWAGLIELEEVPPNTRRHTERPAYIREREVVAAPQIHRQKIDPKITEHARGVCYYRMHDLMQRRPVAVIESEAAA